MFPVMARLMRIHPNNGLALADPAVRAV